MEGLRVRRRGSIALAAAVLLSLLALQTVGQSDSRVKYWGEDVHAILLATARQACKAPERAPLYFSLISNLTGPVRLETFNLSVKNSSSLSAGALVCSARLLTNLGPDTFLLNYTYRLVDIRVDALTGRIVRVYEIWATQRFAMPVYNYVIEVAVRLTPLCPHYSVNATTMAVVASQPCTLTDKWGNKLVIPGG